MPGIPVLIELRYNCTKYGKDCPNKFANDNAIKPEICFTCISNYWLRKGRKQTKANNAAKTIKNKNKLTQFEIETELFRRVKIQCKSNKMIIKAHRDYYIDEVFKRIWNNFLEENQ